MPATVTLSFFVDVSGIFPCRTPRFASPVSSVKNRFAGRASLWLKSRSSSSFVLRRSRGLPPLSYVAGEVVFPSSCACFFYPTFLLPPYAFLHASSRCGSLNFPWQSTSDFSPSFPPPNLFFAILGEFTSRREMRQNGATGPLAEQFASDPPRRFPFLLPSAIAIGPVAHLPLDVAAPTSRRNCPSRSPEGTHSRRRSVISRLALRLNCCSHPLFPDG